MTAHVFNARHELVTTTDPLGRVTRVSSDARGMRSRAVDGGNNPSWAAFDESGNERMLVDARGGVTVREFDAAGNRVSLLDPVGNLWLWAFDADNREVKRTDPFGKSVSTTYNTAGLADTITDRGPIRCQDPFRYLNSNVMI